MFRLNENFFLFKLDSHHPLSHTLTIATTTIFSILMCVFNDERLNLKDDLLES